MATMRWAGYVGPMVLICPPCWSSFLLAPGVVHGFLRGSVNVAKEATAVFVTHMENFD